MMVSCIFFLMHHYTKWVCVKVNRLCIMLVRTKIGQFDFVTSWMLVACLCTIAVPLIWCFDLNQNINTTETLPIPKHFVCIYTHVYQCMCLHESSKLQLVVTFWSSWLTCEWRGPCDKTHTSNLTHINTTVTCIITCVVVLLYILNVYNGDVHLKPLRSYQK